MVVGSQEEEWDTYCEWEMVGRHGWCSTETSANTCDVGLCSGESLCRDWQVLQKTSGAVIFLDCISTISERICKLRIINQDGCLIGTYWTHQHRGCCEGMVLFAGDSHQSSQLDMDRNNQFNTILWSIWRKRWCDWCLQDAELWM